jgi:putative holliday junction resolvase
MSTWLGIDVGSQVIGVAVGSLLTQSARPLISIQAHPEAEMWRALEKLEREWLPSGYAVGLPLTLEGAEQPISKRARAFARQLEKRVQKPVVLVDERSSTRNAKALLGKHGASRRMRWMPGRRR